MHTFTVQGCSVCNQRLCFLFFFLRLKSSRSNVPQQGSTASYNAREPLLQSVVSHCRFLQTWDVLWWTFSNKKISSFKIKHEKKNPTKSPRWQALSYVQVKLPSQDKNNSCIMAQLLVFFATSKCSPHVIKWFLNRHLNQSMLMFCMCQKNSLWNTWKRKRKTNDSSWAFASVPPEQNKTKKAHKKIICTFISQERKSHESRRTWARTLKQINQEKVETQQHLTGLNGFFWLSGSLVR